MKNTFFMIAALLMSAMSMAQPKVTELDKSPMDVSYYPANYPILKMSGKVTTEPLARILYSRPQKKGRNIFGEEVKYNDIWRIGANESTEFELFKNATIGDKKVPKGRYSMFCIPSENKWTLILNKDNFSWGSFSYRSEKDAARIDVPVQKNGDDVEALTMFFDNNNKSNLVIMWDTTKVVVPIIF